MANHCIKNLSITGLNPFPPPKTTPMQELHLQRSKCFVLMLRYSFTTKLKLIPFIFSGNTTPSPTGESASTEKELVYLYQKRTQRGLSWDCGGTKQCETWTIAPMHPQQQEVQDFNPQNSQKHPTTNYFFLKAFDALPCLTYTTYSMDTNTG